MVVIPGAEQQVPRAQNLGSRNDKGGVVIPGAEQQVPRAQNLGSRNDKGGVVIPGAEQQVPQAQNLGSRNDKGGVVIPRETRVLLFHHKSSTSSADFARDTHTMMLSARSSSVSTKSRWSASPASKRVRQVPQVPLSHDEGTRQPCARNASIIDVPAGTVTTSPDFARRTSNGTSSTRGAASALVKLSKWIADVGQWPVMSRTVSIRPCGPQQYTCAAVGRSNSGQRSKA